MNKTIRVKKELNFRELMEYIIENDISGDFKCLNGRHEFSVGRNGTLFFGAYHYGEGETYELDVDEDITEDTEFECVVINTEHYIYSFRYISIKESRDKLPKAVEIFARIDGRMQKVWERDEND